MVYCFFFFFFKQKTAYEISACLVGSEMCIRDRLFTFYGYGYGVFLLVGLTTRTGESKLPANNEYYQKEDLTAQLNNEKSLLFQLQKKISINCPKKVIGKIMSENYKEFPLSECEVFGIQQ
eukprot:TRINITY_DN3999_c0_g2_i1.p2 TRINITY_DN3999_c0_g2~~TRINITY_DN3999_c0_g2_i1.p2  ORF type:complete len:121 (+),score=19.43 TRINITY_DN3999_c0_g2_i1:2-364(+)